MISKARIVFLQCFFISSPSYFGYVVPRKKRKHTTLISIRRVGGVGHFDRLTWLCFCTCPISVLLTLDCVAHYSSAHNAKLIEKVATLHTVQTLPVYIHSNFCIHHFSNRTLIRSCDLIQRNVLLYDYTKLSICKTPRASNVYVQCYIVLYTCSIDRYGMLYSSRLVYLLPNTGLACEELHQSFSLSSPFRAAHHPLP